MCSGCSINIYRLIEWLIFLSPLSLVLVFFSLQTGCLCPGPGSPAGIQGQWDDPRITHLLLLLWLRPETTALSLDQLWFLPLGSQVLSQSCFPWIGTYWGHLALPPRLMALTALVISPIFFSVLIAVWCWVAMTTDWLASNSWTGKHAAIKNYKWCLIVCCQ